MIIKINFTKVRYEYKYKYIRGIKRYCDSKFKKKKKLRNYLL